MSSVTRFLRQIPTGLGAYESKEDELYVMIPGTGNYVGNYPTPPYTTASGYMVKVPAGVVGGPSTPRIARDMGKTVYAPISAAGTGADIATAAPGYFRAIQIISPVSVPLPTSVTNFGVQGSVPGSLPAGNVGDMGYNTFYVPIVVNGIVASNGAGVNATQYTGGLRLTGQL
jgi:hypothetical protein